MSKLMNRMSSRVELVAAPLQWFGNRQLQCDAEAIGLVQLAVERVSWVGSAA
jgi:hypothetical protein